MKINRSIIFSVGGGIAGLLVLGASFILYRGIVELNSTKGELDKKKRNLSSYYGKKPFPSQKNVARIGENEKEIGIWTRRLTGDIRRGELEIVQYTPSKFIDGLGTSRNKMLHRAERTGIAVLDGFAFGFERYFAEISVLPAPSHVRRLTYQLGIVEQISEVLFDSKVKEINRIEREVFETRAVGAAAPKPAVRGSRRASRRRPRRNVPRRTQPKAPTLPKLYSKEHFIVEFVGKERAMINVLNRLSSHEMLVVVTKVTMDKREEDVTAVAVSTRADHAAAKKSAKDGEQGTKRDRMVSGPEMERLMLIALEMDVCRFKSLDSK